MLRFLFGKKGNGVKVNETQREAFTRIIDDLNGLIVVQGVKPKIVIEPNTGTIELQLPEQLADEALALPAPDKAENDDEAPKAVAAE